MSQKIYNLLSYQQDILFFTLDDANKGVVTSQYLWNDYSNCNGSIKLQKYEEMIYAAYNCNGYTAISVFNITKGAFLASYRTTQDIRNLTFSPVQAFFADASGGGSSIMIIRGPVNSINSMYGLNAGDFYMVPSSDKRSYSVIDDDPSNYTITNSTGEEYIEIVENTYITVSTIENVTASDIEFFLEPLDFGSVLNNHQYSQPVSYT
jgi:hypothetical protein